MASWVQSITLSSKCGGICHIGGQSFMLSTDIGCGWPVALHCLDGRCLIGVRALQCHLKVMIDGKCRPEYRHHKEMLDVSRGTGHNIVF